MGAALHAVPDLPDDGDDLHEAIPTLFLPRPAHHGGPGEYPLAPPAPADGEQEQPDSDAEDSDLELDHDQEEDEGEWEPARRGLTFPDLRPYADVPEAARLLVTGSLALGRVAVEQAPAGGRWLLRVATGGRRLLAAATAHVAAVLGPGTKAAFGWCHGGEGATGPLKRTGIAAAGLFAAGHAAGIPGPWRLVAPGIWFLGFLLAGRPAKTPEKAPAEANTKTPKGKEKEAPAEVSKESGPPPEQPPAPALLPASPQTVPLNMMAFFPKAPETPEETPTESLAEVPEEPPAAPPRPPSRDDLTRALHHLYTGGSGVLHTALQKHLHLPDTRALKAALTAAGIPSRPGVRTPAGNGPGTHLNDFPPLPLSLGDARDEVVCAGQEQTTTTPTSGEGSREGVRVKRTDYGLTTYFAPQAPGSASSEE
ncbi:hypothetical protein ACFY0N_00645 [Streptomyces vinaceus]|uniref:hypothetical protein n=1 Tax=Streptomyces vinaceus TaxID=1960 RepID=UPI00368D97BE